MLTPGLALAKLMLEPVVNSTSGKFKRSSNTGKLSGNSYGINIGYMGDYFMIGLNVEKGQFEFDDNVTESNYDTFDAGGIGSYLGFHLFDRFKIWTGYQNSVLEPTSNNDVRYFGQYFTYGIGYRLFSGLMLNYQQFNNYYTQKEDDTTGKTEGLQNNIRTYGSSISLSYIIRI